MRYGWRNFAFDLPDGLADESALAFLALRGDAVAFSVTLSRVPLTGTVDAYLADAVAELRRSLPGYKPGSQTSRKVNGLDARVLEHTATSPDGKMLCQLQAYVASSTEVLILTATGREDQRAPLAKAFEHILGSLSTS